MSEKKYLFFSKKPLRQIVFVAFLGFLPSLSAEGLNVAWKDVVTAAAEFTSRGIALNDVMEEALLFGANDTLTQKVVSLFITLFDNLFAAMWRSVNFETSRATRDVHNYLFNVVMKNSQVRQRIALEVFKNYKKWNVSFSSSGDVDRLDHVVFSSFLSSFNQEFFKGLLGEEGLAVSRTDYDALRDRIDRLAAIVMPTRVGVLARSGKNRVNYSWKKGVNAAKNTVRSAKNTVGEQIKRISFKKIFSTVGTVSAVGAFLMGSYAFMYRKKVLREFGLEVLKLSSGVKDAAKEATLLYAVPETRWERILGKIKDWIYNDPEIRRDRAAKLKKEILLPSVGYMPAESSEHDSLTDLLMFAASHPTLVKREKMEMVKEEWVQDIRRRNLLSKQRKDAQKAKLSKDKGFVRAAQRYLKQLGVSFFVQKQASAVLPAKQISGRFSSIKQSWRNWRHSPERISQDGVTPTAPPSTYDDVVESVAYQARDDSRLKQVD